MGGMRVRQADVLLASLIQNAVREPAAPRFGWFGDDGGPVLVVRLIFGFGWFGGEANGLAGCVCGKWRGSAFSVVLDFWGAGYCFFCFTRTREKEGNGTAANRIMVVRIRRWSFGFLTSSSWNMQQIRGNGTHFISSPKAISAGH
jgi:hypothetical protein